MQLYMFSQYLKLPVMFILTSCSVTGKVNVAPQSSHRHTLIMVFIQHLNALDQLTLFILLKL